MIRSLAMFTILHTVSGIAHGNTRQAYCVPKVGLCPKPLFATSAASCKAAPDPVPAPAPTNSTPAVPAPKPTPAPELTCGDGEGDSGDKKTCCTCTNGWYRKSDSTDLKCKQCPLKGGVHKTTSSTGSTSLVDCMCPKGYISDGDSCKACEKNTYNDALGASTCKACPSGRHTNEKTGQRHVDDCGICDVTHYWDSDKCTVCPDKKLGFGGTGADACKACPDGQKQILSCSVTKDKDGKSKIDSCSAGSCVAKCPAGYVKTSSGGRHVDICSGCPPHQYSTEEDAAKCEDAYCPAGKYGALLFQEDKFFDPTKKGATSEADVIKTLCTSCPAGKYTAAGGKNGARAFCKTCENDKWSADGAEKCTACAADKFYKQGQSEPSPCPTSSLTSGAVTLGAGISSTVILVATLGQLQLLF